MTEVAFDLPKVYPPIEPPNQAEGEVGILSFLYVTFSVRLIIEDSVSLTYHIPLGMFCG